MKVLAATWLLLLAVLGCSASGVGPDGRSGRHGTLSASVVPSNGRTVQRATRAPEECARRPSPARLLERQSSPPRYSSRLYYFVRVRASIRIAWVEQTDCKKLYAATRCKFDLVFVETLAGEGRTERAVIEYSHRHSRRHAPYWLPTRIPAAGSYLIVFQGPRPPNFELDEGEGIETVIYENRVRERPPTPDHMDVLDGCDDPYLSYLRELIAEEARSSTPAARRERYLRWREGPNGTFRDFAKHALERDQDLRSLATPE